MNTEKHTRFINHSEITDTIGFVATHRNEAPLIEAILRKGACSRGLSPREAALLLESELPDIEQRIFSLARDIKKRFYGNRIVLFAPLYLSNHCVNGCTYCPYHSANKEMPRRKLTQQEIRREVIALQQMGHKRIALEAGEDSVHNPLDYILQSIHTIYDTHYQNGAIRRVNVNIAATSVENYRKLHNAGIGTYILFQETYHRENYEALHPSGPKHDFDYHTLAMDRAMQGGIDDVGIGVLFGLNHYLYDFIGLLTHAAHLESSYGVGPHTVSVPRLCEAEGIHPADFHNAIPDSLFKRIVAVLRIALPYTGLIVSTRETAEMRQQVLALGVSQISGASSTSVGGYAAEVASSAASRQFEVNDHRSLAEITAWLIQKGYIPSFCTACYREGRTGDRFMKLVKSGKIADCCLPNALLTLQEYLEDYAPMPLRDSGNKLIATCTTDIPSDSVRKRLIENLSKIKKGERDFRF